jgi:hypothetical protein
MTILQLILSILSTAAAAAQAFVAGNPEAAAADALAESLIKIAQQAALAYQQATGTPIDLNLLKPIDPVP